MTWRNESFPEEARREAFSYQEVNPISSTRNLHKKRNFTTTTEENKQYPTKKDVLSSD
jgi:hypothetical protein